MSEQLQRLPVETLAPFEVTVASRELPSAHRLNPEHPKFGTPSEDVLCLNLETSTFIVADAAGKTGRSQRGTAEAAVGAIDTYFANPDVRKGFDSGELSVKEAQQHLRQAFRLSRRAVVEEGHEGLAAVLCIKPFVAEGKRQLGIANAGDSRALLSPSIVVPGLSTEYAKAMHTKDGDLLKPDILYQLTDDQSVGNILLNGFSATKRDMDSSGDNYAVVPLTGGSRLLLGSDGVFGDWPTQHLKWPELKRAFAMTDPEEAADYIIRIGNKIDDKALAVIDFEAPAFVPFTRRLEEREVIAVAAREPAPQKQNTKTQKERLRATEHLKQLRNVYAAALVAQEALPIVDAEYMQSNDTMLEDAQQAYDEFVSRVQNAESQYLQTSMHESDEFIARASAVAADLEGKSLQRRVFEHKLAATEDYMFNKYGELIEVPGMRRQVRKLQKWAGRLFGSKEVPAAQPFINEVNPDVVTYVMRQEAEPEPQSRPSVMARARRRLMATKQAITDKTLFGAAVLTNLQFNRDPSKQFVGHLEEEKKQRLVWGAALGVVALAAASRFGIDSMPFDLPFHGHHGGSGVGPVSPDIPEHTQTPTPQKIHANDGTLHLKQHHEYQLPRHATMSHGDTVWGIAEHSLGSNASVEDIDRVKDAILQQNGISEHQAHSLPVNTRLNMPVELIEQIRKQSAK